MSNSRFGGTTRDSNACRAVPKAWQLIEKLERSTDKWFLLFRAAPLGRRADSTSRAPLLGAPEVLQVITLQLLQKRFN